jgi:hypothetical protein
MVGLLHEPNDSNSQAWKVYEHWPTLANMRGGRRSLCSAARMQDRPNLPQDLFNGLSADVPNHPGQKLPITHMMCASLEPGHKSDLSSCDALRGSPLRRIILQVD